MVVMAILAMQLIRRPAIAATAQAIAHAELLMHLVIAVVNVAEIAIREANSIWMQFFASIRGNNDLNDRTSCEIRRGND